MEVIEVKKKFLENYIGKGFAIPIKNGYADFRKGKHRWHIDIRADKKYEIDLSLEDIKSKNEITIPESNGEYKIIIK